MENYDKLYKQVRKEASLILKEVETLNNGFNNFYSNVNPKEKIKDFAKYIKK